MSVEKDNILDLSSQDLSSARKSLERCRQKRECQEYYRNRPLLSTSSIDQLDHLGLEPTKESVASIR